MNEELSKGYTNFLLASIKTYFLGNHIIEKEISIFTNNKLQDGVLFFLCAFDKNTRKLKVKSATDINELKEYILINEKSEFIGLTPKGTQLKDHLEQKLKNQCAMLEFNGVKPKDIAKTATTLKRFEKFWSIMNMFERKSATG